MAHRNLRCWLVCTSLVALASGSTLLADDGRVFSVLMAPWTIVILFPLYNSPGPSHAGVEVTLTVGLPFLTLGCLWMLRYSKPWLILLTLWFLWNCHAMWFFLHADLGRA